MSAVTFALFILIRMLIPFGLLVAVGEWVRRREIRYWFPN